MQIELVLYLTGNQGLIISSAQLMGIAGNSGVCFFAGLVVLMVPTVFLLSVWYMLFVYVRPSSRAAKIGWNEEERQWALATNRPESGKEDSASNGAEKVTTPKVSGGPRRSSRSFVTGRRGSSFGGRRSSFADAVLIDAASLVAAPTESGHADIMSSGRMVHAMPRLFNLGNVTSRVIEAVKSDFHDLSDPFLEGWHSKRLAWIGPALQLSIEYGLGLAMGFGIMASCEVEQVLLGVSSVCAAPSHCCVRSVGLQIANIVTVAVYVLFLLLSRPYDDTIFETYELITSAGQLAMMIIVIVGYFELVEAPQGAFIGVIAFILIGQVGMQVRFVCMLLSSLSQSIFEWKCGRKPRRFAAAGNRPREDHAGARACPPAAWAHPIVPSCAGSCHEPPHQVSSHRVGPWPFECLAR
jgi:hypothetical protein